MVLSGTLGDHGMSVMMARGDLDIEAEIESDTAAVHTMVEALLAAAPNTRWMRDPTRGGLGTICNELAQDASVAVILDEELLPVAPMVQGACDLLGIDPVYVANEGKFVAVVPPDEAQAAIAALRAASARPERGCHRRDRRRTRGHRCPAHTVRRQPDRRHARR